MILTEEDLVKLRKDVNELMHRPMLTQEGIDQFLEKVARVSVNSYEDKQEEKRQEAEGRRRAREAREAEES